jgi:lipocalin
VTVHLASCQIAGFGKCPVVETAKDFDITKFKGTWYEIKKYYYYYSAVGKCNTENYQVDDKGIITVDRVLYGFLANESTSGPLTIVSPGVMNGFFATLNCKLIKTFYFQIF